MFGREIWEAFAEISADELFFGGGALMSIALALVVMGVFVWAMLALVG